MTHDTNVWATTVVSEAGVATNTPAGEAVDFRADILLMTQAAEDAVLRPADPGRWPHALRAALASRVARLNDAADLAARYQAMIGSSEYDSVADPTSTGQPADMKTCLEFMDRVALRPRDITEDDIKILQDAEIEDADIVRLLELNAFLGYQIRLVQGLSLLKGF